MRSKCLAGLAKLRRLRNVLPASTKTKLFNALVRPHLDYCSVVWQECLAELQPKLERVQNYGMRLILSQPPRTPSDGLRKVMKWMPLKKRREMFRLILVQRCVTKQAPQCLREVFRTNGEVGYSGTRGCNKLFLPSVRTEYYRRSFIFKGTQG